MLDPAAQQREQLARTLQVGRSAADKPQQLALPRRAHAAADRTFEVTRASCPDPGSHRLLRGRPDGAHVDEEMVPLRAGEQAVRREVHLLERRLVGQHRDHRRHLAGQRRRRRRPAGAFREQRLRAVRGAVPDAHLMARPKQPPRDGRAHLAGPGDPDLHAVSLTRSCAKLS
jgi:hypothetical protein